MNAQMGNDFETVNSRNFILNKLNGDLAARLHALKEELDFSTKSAEQYKTRMENACAEQRSLTTELKASRQKFTLIENEMFDLKSKLDANQMENENLLIELHEQKVRENSIHSISI